ncbi:MAG TPA: SDR family oxidoreductase [Alphaproteobacteria bacterium]|nr:SDR family oxidoreductase [Alphaproteobacteria bacterium]
MPRLFVFGLGYSALALAKVLQHEGWSVAGTSRGVDGLHRLRDHGIEAIRFDGTQPLAPDALDGVTHLLCSIPADPDDPALRRNSELIASASSLAWIGYLSTTSVYGVTDGSTVDEDTLCDPSSARGKRRLAAERAWQALPLPGHVFRLSGIYGPGRSVFETIRGGRAQRIVKPGQVFNRIHVDDIANVLLCSMAAPSPGRVYNVADDLPAPSADLVTYACGLLNVKPPKEIPFDAAVLSPMAREFWADNKRISNQRMKDELGVELAYPTYRVGLDAIFETL